MVSSSASRAGPASAHSVYDILIRNIDINSVIDGCFHSFKSTVKSLRLRNGSRETIQNVTLAAVVTADSVNDEVTGEFIRNQKSLIHILPGLFAKLRSILDIRAENVTR